MEIEAIVDKPEDHRAFLEGLDPSEGIDPNDPCGCFLHRWLEARGVPVWRVTLDYVEVRPADGDPRVPPSIVPIEGGWADVYQLRLLDLIDRRRVYDEEGDDLSEDDDLLLAPADALAALDEVLADGR